MDLIPAVDVRDGRVVRLVEGDFARMIAYGHDPVALAVRMAEEGCGRLHLVDLDGARSGELALDLVAAVAGAADIEVQVGGGIRSPERAEEAVAAGAARVVVGTIAVHDPVALAAIVDRVGGERVIAAVDVAGGAARGSAWSDEGREVAAVLADAVAAGIGGVLVTAIARDGTMAGPDLDLLTTARRAAPSVELIASGGVGSLADLELVAGTGADAVVVGRALLEGRFSVAAARRLVG